MAFVSPLRAASAAMMMRALGRAAATHAAPPAATTAAAAAAPWARTGRRAAATLSGMFDAKVAAAPFHDAVVLASAGAAGPRDEEPAPYKLSFRELGRAVDAFANGMGEVGVRSGDAVLSLWDVAGGGTSTVEYAYVQVRRRARASRAREARSAPTAAFACARGGPQLPRTHRCPSRSCARSPAAPPAAARVREGGHLPRRDGLRGRRHVGRRRVGAQGAPATDPGAGRSAPRADACFPSRVRSLTAAPLRATHGLPGDQGEGPDSSEQAPLLDSGGCHVLRRRRRRLGHRHHLGRAGSPDDRPGRQRGRHQGTRARVTVGGRAGEVPGRARRLLSRDPPPPRPRPAGRLPPQRRAALPPSAAGGLPGQDRPHLRQRLGQAGAVLARSAPEGRLPFPHAHPADARVASPVSCARL